MIANSTAQSQYHTNSVFLFSTSTDGSASGA